MNQIRGVAELATNAYAAAGPQALADYLAPDVLEKCPQERLALALEGHELPSGFRDVDNAVFEDGDRVRATVTQAFDGVERSAEWVFRRSGGGMWRIAEMPGIEECLD